MGGNRLPRNLTIPEAKLIPLLTLQTDTTMVMKMTTPNRTVQTNPEDPEGLMVLEVQMVPEAPEVPADLATTPPMSKTSCRNS